MKFDIKTEKKKFQEEESKVKGRCVTPESDICPPHLTHLFGAEGRNH